MKSINELTQDSSSYKLLTEWEKEASNQVKILSPNLNNRDSILLDLQMTTKSLLGTVSYNTGGILVDNGWLRILGSGNSQLNRDIVTWNLFKNGKCSRQPEAIIVADDILGGFFALNGGAFPGNTGEVYYLAPDTLEWESLEMKYSEFINWAFFGDIEQFYESFRWSSWKNDILNVNSEQGVLVYPFLWAEGEELEKRSRSIVPIEELWNSNNEHREKFGII
ncbi:MAG: DUF2625 domain-containing protein [Gorillibacterium sp.]|nr:DUF2625 domain-containing protein [Gorillibacterium sp.]